MDNLQKFRSQRYKVFVDILIILVFSKSDIQTFISELTQFLPKKNMAHVLVTTSLLR